MSRKLLIIIMLCGVLALAANADVRLLPSQFQLLGPIAILLIMFAAWRNRDSKQGWSAIWIVAGLAISAVADIGLMIPGYFIACIVGFMIVHLCYLIAFCLRARLAARRTPLIICMLWVVCLLLVAMPHVPNELRVAISIYALCIGLMCAQAITVYLAKRHEADGDRHMYAAAGAVCFLLTDSILIISLYVTQVPFGNICVFALFGLAELWIGHSIIRQVNRMRVRSVIRI